MNAKPDELSELRELTLAYHEGTLTEDDAARLEALVLNEPAACAEFVRRSAIVTDLQWQLGAVNANAFPLLPPEAGRASADEPAKAAAAKADVDRTGAVPLAANSNEPSSLAAGSLPISPAPIQSLSQSVQQHPLLYLAAAIVLFLSLWSATGYLLTNRSAQNAVANEAKLGFPRAVARLTRTLDAQWGVGSINDGAFLRSGERLDLVAGLAEITYKNGAVVLLEAPVSYLLNDRETDDPSSRALKGCDGFLETGRISVRAPQAAHGFTLKTSAVTVIDMAAEFGVAVNPNDAVSLMVYSGAAEIRVDEKYGDWQQRVEAGCSARFDPRELGPIPQTAEEAGPFVRKLPEVQPPLMLHWDFNAAADDGKLVLDRSGQGRHGRFVGNSGHAELVEGPEGFGRALSLNGSEEIVELEEPQWSRLDDSFSDFTVALWMKPAETRKREMFVCGKMGWKYHRGWQLTLTPNENLPRLVFFRYAADSEPAELVSTKAAPVGQFSHLAMVFKGGQYARLYLNGEQVGELTDVAPRINGANQVNLQVGNRGEGRKGHFFEGLVDDLRIYQSALSGTMVRRLMQPGTHSTMPIAIEATNSIVKRGALTGVADD